MRRYYIKDYSNVRGGKTGNDWNIPLKEVFTNEYEVYEENGELYQDCPFCATQNKYLDWVCRGCGAQ